MLTRVTYPSSPADFESFRSTLREHVTLGYVPATPPLSRDSTIIAQGSCFAGYIHEALSALGIRSVHLSFMEVLNSPWANEVFLQYALEGRPFQTGNHERFFQASSDVAPSIKSAAALIFTVGVAWVPVLDGQILLGFTKEELGQMTWRLTSVAENAEHLRNIVQIVQKANPAIRIILTVSPVPIKNAFTGASAVTADCASKSILRAAVQEVLDDSSLQNVSYWPSFEAIRWLSGHMGQIFGTEGENQRRPGRTFVNAITEEFVAAYFESAT